jgi:hypothetical protein
LASGRATKAPRFASSFELLIPVLPDHLGATGKEVLWGDVPESAVEADAIVVVDKPSDDPPGLVERARGGGSNGIGLERLVPTLELSVGLRVIGRDSDVGHSCDSDEFLEVLCNKLRAIIADDTRSGAGELLSCALEDAFDIAL